MAFVSKSERSLLTFKIGATEHVGPGAYVGHVKYKTKQSYAPFSSTSHRDPQKLGIVPPGPGQYNTPDPTTEKIDQYGNVKLAGGFASQDVRFKNKNA